MNHTSFSKGILKKGWESVKMDMGIRAFISKPVSKGILIEPLGKY
jgi:hypothetical protein